MIQAHKYHSTKLPSSRFHYYYQLRRKLQQQQQLLEEEENYRNNTREERTELMQGQHHRVTPPVRSQHQRSRSTTVTPRATPTLRPPSRSGAPPLVQAPPAPPANTTTTTSPSTTTTTTNHVPPRPSAAELSENNDRIRLTIDLPGVMAKDVDVSIHHGILTIQGVRKTMSLDGTVCIKKQRFHRRYAIDTDVIDIAQLTANLAFGVLSIRAPKRPRHNQNFHVVVTEDSLANRDDMNQQVCVVGGPPPPGPHGHGEVNQIHNHSSSSSSSGSSNLELAGISGITAARLAASTAPTPASLPLQGLVRDESTDNTTHSSVVVGQHSEDTSICQGTAAGDTFLSVKEEDTLGSDEGQ